MKKILNFLLNPYLLGGMVASGIFFGVLGTIIYDTNATTYWHLIFPQLFYVPLELSIILGIIFFFSGLIGWIKDIIKSRKINK